MTNNNDITTVQTLIQELTKYDKNLLISIFDNEKGYMSVAFKKDQTVNNGKTFQWLTFYAHDHIQMYSIETLLGYLEKLPKQATIAKKTTENEYTPLFLSSEAMKEKGKIYQWLVISDESEYDRFFRPQTIKSDYMTKALEKMLLELKNNSSESVERVHQWICKQTNQELFKGIMTEGKTLKGALEYCSDTARKVSENNRFAMIEDDTVFSWVCDYFITYELPEKEKKPKSKKATNKKVKKSENSVSITKAKNTEETKELEKGESKQVEIDLFATV